MPDNILAELQYNLIAKFANINIEKYDYIKYEELFSLILKLVQNLLPTYFLSITHTSINSESINIIIKSDNSNHSSINRLSISFGVQEFAVNTIEVSILH